MTEGGDVKATLLEKFKLEGHAAGKVEPDRRA